MLEYLVVELRDADGQPVKGGLSLLVQRYCKVHHIHHTGSLMLIQLLRALMESFCNLLSK